MCRQGNPFQSSSETPLRSQLQYMWQACLALSAISHSHCCCFGAFWLHFWWCGGRLYSRESSCTTLYLVAVTLWLKGAMAAQFGSCLRFHGLPEKAILFLGTPGLGEESLVNTRVLGALFPAQPSCTLPPIGYGTGWEAFQAHLRLLGRSSQHTTIWQQQKKEIVGLAQCPFPSHSLELAPHSLSSLPAQAGPRIYPLPTEGEGEGHSASRGR